jgi:hypothetical protein
MFDAMDRIATLRQFAKRHVDVPCGHVADAARLETTTASVCFCSQAFVVPVADR